MRTLTKVATFGAAAVLLTVGAAPLLVSGADHLDAPALGGLTNSAGDLAPHSEHGDRDINDLFVFAKGSSTVLALTTNPAINLFGGHFGTNVRYVIDVDTTGDSVQDVAFVATFGDVNGAGDQHYVIRRYAGARARLLTGGTPVATGFSNAGSKSIGPNNEWAWAGVRSDPFFFDLTGFLGSVKGVGTEALGSNPTDFFVGLNTNAIVLQVPNAEVGGSGTHIGVWATTSFYDGTTWRRADQVGRPAINTVFNPGDDKNDFNATNPSAQRTAFGGKFRTNIVNTLEHLGGYSAGTAGTIADILLPDVMTFTVADTSGFLNGRRLADDVIDVELNLVTNGAITGDGVGPHADYLSSFPYLGVPH